AITDQVFRGDLIDLRERDSLQLGRPLTSDDYEFFLGESKPSLAIFRIVIEVAGDDGNQLALVDALLLIDVDELSRRRVKLVHTAASQPVSFCQVAKDTPLNHSP